MLPPTDHGGTRSMTRAPALLAGLLACWTTTASYATDVAVCTDRGRAIIELADEQAPRHVANFLRYVESGHYSGTVFHRVVRGFVVQGGGMDRKLRARAALPPVANESSNGLRNTRGTVAAARTADPNSAAAQFFVNLSDNVALDPGREPGYTVFGRVREGMEVFDSIGMLPTGRSGPFRSDVPTPLVAIKSIARYDEQAIAAMPADGREAALKAEIAAAAAAPEQGLRLIERYRSICGSDDAEISLWEAQHALATGARRHALIVLDELLLTTPGNAAAVALYRSALQVIPECEPAVPPALPDAAVASLEQMVAAQQDVRTFVAAGEAYLACLATVIDDEQRGAADRNLGVTEHNRTVAVMEETAADFNARLRTFRSRK
jgi:cyclophilin family peptidyl-prolyl cis-trans isomerase